MLYFSRGESMAGIAFLGLGVIGRPMAERLLESGHEVVVWNRTAAKAQPLVERAVCGHAKGGSRGGRDCGNDAHRRAGGT
jgi:nucleoside-diphosphate-sugar epimerase